MAYLDMSVALLDPMIGDPFVVHRRTQAVSQATGRNSISFVPMNAFGVVCVASPNDLERLPEGQRMDRHFSIVTKFRLQGPAEPNIQPDIILWNGSRLIVKTVEPYPQYGQGFVQAIAGSTDIIDPPVV